MTIALGYHYLENLLEFRIVSAMVIGFHTVLRLEPCPP